MNRRDVEDIIIGLLAENLGKDPVDYRAELEDLSELMPIDSIVAAEVIARLEELFDVRFSATAEASANLRSVALFATAILALVEEHAGGQAEPA